tara:strand:- start:395 stop:2641 length:2247 start_codon:yes stop_codon:yes gene_type:complete
VKDCFVKNKIIAVDKTLCGNGFSTSFLKIKPRTGKINILIAPNKAVVLSKQKDYANGKIKGGNVIKFFYLESTEFDFTNADILFFVSDSFLMMREKIFEITNLVDKVLIDEYHSTEIQSLFRKSLVDFPARVKELCSNKFTSIVTVTASPNLFSKVDIKLQPEIVPETIIQIEYDKEKTIERIQDDLLEDKEVVVFTNSSRNIYSLRNKYSEVEARFIVGSTFLQSLFEVVRVIENDSSNLTIVSGRGFEGFDIDYKHARVYFLEDRAFKFQTFYLSNLYQALSRTRRGAGYVEYCRQSLSEDRTPAFKDVDKEVTKFIEDKNLSVENKQKREYKDYHPFVVFNQNDAGTFSIKKNKAAVELLEETILWDNFGYGNAFDNFLKDRNITLLPCENPQKRISTRISEDTKIKNLYDNRLLIEKSDVFGQDYRLNCEQQIYQKKNTPIRFSYLQYLKNYLRRKNYDKEYDNSLRQEVAIDILINQSNFNKLSRRLVSSYNKRSIAKYGRRASEPYRRDFKLQATKRLCQLIIMLANDRISVPSRWVANRDYNLLTTVGIDELEMLAEVFHTKVQEVDIKACFPRVLYAMSKLELPENFYGQDKKNKLDINVALNDFFYHEHRKSSKKHQKQNEARRFQKLNIDEVVTDYLFEKFFESPFKGDLFNFLSYHEKRIITKVKTMLQELERSHGVVRRHDSVILFNNSGRISFLNELKFLGVGGWFDVPDSRSPLYNYREDLEFEINDKIPFSCI